MLVIPEGADRCREGVACSFAAVLALQGMGSMALRLLSPEGCHPVRACGAGQGLGSFGTDRREDIAKYVIAVEVPSHAEHSEHDADPGFQEFNRLADAFQPEDPLVYGGQVLHAV